MASGLYPHFQKTLEYVSVSDHTPPFLFLLVPTLVIGYIITRTIYLLHFHPLASFPGPRGAALSTWWLYALGKSGRTCQTYEMLHNKYKSQAIRIGPNELHISDPDLYNVIYSQKATYKKSQFFYNGFNTPHSIFAETDVDLHRIRRKDLNPFFSKTSSRAMHGIVLGKIEILCRKISERKDDGSINIYNAFRSLMVDLITEVAFGRSFNLLSTSQGNNFDAPFLQVFDSATENLWDFMYIPVTRSITNYTPPMLARRLSAVAGNFQRLNEEVKRAIADFRALESSGKESIGKTVFGSIPHLEDNELLAQGTTILIAGSDTTASTLTMSVYEMIRNPLVLQNLRKELEEAEIGEDYDILKLEQLPYLSAVVKEAIRVAMAVPGRLPRVVPKTGNGVSPLRVDGKMVPAGTIVSISAYTVHTNENIWGEDARKFNPDRWLTDDAKNLEKYLVSFSKGARACIGLNFAYTELTLALAVLVRRFDFTWDESLKEVDLDRVDQFTIAYKGSGLRANVREVAT